MKYWIGLILAGSIAGFLLVLVLLVVLGGFGIKNISGSWVLLFMLVTSATISIGTILSQFLLSWHLGWQPSFKVKGSKKSEVHDDARVLELSEKSRALNRAIESPKELTLGTLESISKEAISFIDELTAISKSQNQELEELRHTLEIEQNRTEDAIRQKETVEPITKDQLASIKQVITEDSKRWFFYGVIVAFPIGLITSVVGSWFLGEFFNSSAMISDLIK